MQVVLFEDERVDQLAPLTMGRPAYAVACASYRLIDLVESLGPVHVIVREYLREVERANGRQVLNGPDGPGRAVGDTFLAVNSRLVPSVDTLNRLRGMTETAQPAIAVAGESVAAAFVPQPLQALLGAQADSLSAAIRRLELPAAANEFRLLEYPHDVVREHGRSLRENLEFRLRDGYRQFSDGLFVADDVTIGANLVADTRSGPIVLDSGASIGPFCYLCGPAYVGPGARLIEMAVLKDGVTVGARAKIGGEVECSIIEPLSNKQHHGFLGHSYVGSWVNLGAGTSNSDLKNTYGQVTMDYGGRRVPSGMQLIGCFIGDYAKTAVNTGIFTGKSIGVCSMAYGFVTTNVPGFTNYARSLGQVTEIGVDVAVATQARMFARRGIEQRACDVELLRSLFERTRGERANFGQPLPPEPLSL
jgi:UDP-N-acetylglucosamine diphosphorylase / glucose-1-phosphate thymidylyltransferase / UDP-N-acetylgalactosamine diphosphorylase / glucosamine-1-phosphate N-acetyltransferase / galactosamine-1-phosphate N-acetyltransferase